MSELINCPRCGVEIELYYSLYDDTEVVSQERCKCRLSEENKILDRVFKNLESLNLEVLNEEYYRRNN